MKIAVLSDIHGNIWALEAVLADIKKQGVDLIVNAGDILSGCLEPAATADVLISLNLPTIAGNHERQLLARCHHVTTADEQKNADQFAFDHTTSTHQTWLSLLPPTLEITTDIFMCHGTPSSDHTYFLEEVDEHGSRLASANRIAFFAEGIQHSLIICGHSHKPRTHALSNERLVVNPGSVGLQAYDDDHPYYHTIENGSPHARYAICEQNKNSWDIQHRCVTYAHEKAAATAKRNGSESWARWITTGRA
ncbi:metallophosphoesterase [Glaciimonas sp. GS1]|uniref:Metallophosphoesterase n=2 Tax=Glaciimonas soli TaxID=2590999 RepID=A0A843YQ79_9BURK|nr:metallophosphoesterase [Glaciimonas soli]